jgi:betaine reductase
MIGFSPTQGHVASAMPFMGHALDGLRSGNLRYSMFLAKGSLFLGRMTHLSDGESFILQSNQLWTEHWGLRPPDPGTFRRSNASIAG